MNLIRKMAVVSVISARKVMAADPIRVQQAEERPVDRAVEVGVHREAIIASSAVGLRTGVVLSRISLVGRVAQKLAP